MTKVDYPTTLDEMTRAEEAALKRFPNFSAENMDDVMFARYHFRQGYEQAEKDLGWHPFTEHPPVDEEVIVLKDHLNLNCFYQIAFGHIVNKDIAIDYDGWNIEGVKYWMPMPEMPKEK